MALNAQSPVENFNFTYVHQHLNLEVLISFLTLTVTIKNVWENNKIVCRAMIGMEAWLFPVSFALSVFWTTKKRHGHTGLSPVQGHKDNHRADYHIREEAVRVGFVQP